ncbi:MAG: hypothetical protein WC969_08945 [Elusimicrobiota bacterium]|jgi:hypothetical protein
MGKVEAALLFALLPTTALAAPESHRAAGAAAFEVLLAPEAFRAARGAGAPLVGASGAVVSPALLLPSRAPAAAAAPELLGSFRMSERLDAHRRLLRLRLGPGDWDVSMASDPSFSHRYLTFTQGAAVRVLPFDDFNNPSRGSTLILEPAAGTAGPAHRIKTGALFDALRANAYVLRAAGRELWLLYGTDVDPATGSFADSRSLLLIQEDGTNTRMWPITEASLPLDKPAAWTFGTATLTFLRGSNGLLSVFGVR